MSGLLVVVVVICDVYLERREPVIQYMGPAMNRCMREILAFRIAQKKVTHTHTHPYRLHATASRSFEQVDVRAPGAGGGGGGC